MRSRATLLGLRAKATYFYMQVLWFFSICMPLFLSLSSRLILPLIVRLKVADTAAKQESQKCNKFQFLWTFCFFEFWFFDFIFEWLKSSLLPLTDWIETFCTLIKDSHRSQLDSQQKMSPKKVITWNYNYKRGAAISQWIHLRLPSCHPGFKSQARHVRCHNL